MPVGRDLIGRAVPVLTNGARSASKFERRGGAKLDPSSQDANAPALDDRTHRADDRRRPTPPAAGSLSIVGGDPELVHAVLQDAARGAEEIRGARLVEVDVLERGLDDLALELVDGVGERLLLP